MKNFYNVSCFDIGQSGPKENFHWLNGFMSIYYQLNYKFIFCLEGKCISTNLFWAMSSNSVCIMPKPKYESWFMEGKLKDGVHYIEIKDDFYASNFPTFYIRDSRIDFNYFYFWTKY